MSGSRANSPKVGRGKGKMTNFTIHPSKMKRLDSTDVVPRSQYERKGEIHPQLDQLISSEFDDGYKMQEKLMASRTQGLEEDMNDDVRMMAQDQLTETGNNGEPFCLSGKIEQPPFKILRKCPSVWTKKQTPNELNTTTANMESYYLHSALNYDPN